MAGTSTTEFPNATTFYLDPNQQDLLLAALASNGQNTDNLFAHPLESKLPMDGSHFPYQAVDHLDPTYYASPQQSTPSSNFNNVSVDESPFADYLDGDGSFDFDNGDNGDLMIGSLPGDTPRGHSDQETSEKRKSPTDDGDDPDGGGKRREHEDKTAKKPGRKPLTSEPTTKRKAQNRAAQRAFRERKEKHLKDLETKVSELEKASDAANHENGMLRAQVQRLQTELREYRKRLSLNSTGLNRSAPMSNGFSSLLGGSNSGANNFQFEFPRFGGLPSSNGGDSSNKNTTSTAGNGSNRQNSGRSQSPKSKTTGSNTASPDKNGSTAGANGTFNYTGSAHASRGNSTGSTGQNRVFQFNSASSTNSDSPSASSNSLGGMNSSCDTSPEPSHNSPGNGLDTIADGYVCHGNSEGEITFCEKLNMACGNPRNPVPRAMSQSDARPSPTAPANPATDIDGIDFFASQNGGQFDPALFGDYREPQTAIVGDGDFTGGFFNEAFPMAAEFGSPFNFAETPAVQKSNPMDEIERQQDGVDLDDEVVPGEDPSMLLNCHKIWDKLSNRPDFKDGTIDIDNLCTELRAKARCSESGVVVDHKDVEAALQRLPKE